MQKIRLKPNEVKDERNYLAIHCFIFGHIAASVDGNPEKGTSTARIESEKLPRGLCGIWTLQFADSNRYVIKQDSLNAAAGGYYITGDTMKPEDADGSMAYRDSLKAGWYLWTTSNETLRFEKVVDPCVGRSIILTFQVFLRKQ